MTALTSDRNTRARVGVTRVEGLAAAVKVWAASIAMRNAAGYITKGATATGCAGVGRAEGLADNTGGAAGALTVEYAQGIFLFANSSAGDLITIADIGKLFRLTPPLTR